LDDVIAPLPVWYILKNGAFRPFRDRDPFGCCLLPSPTNWQIRKNFGNYIGDIIADLVGEIGIFWVKFFNQSLFHTQAGVA